MPTLALGGSVGTPPEGIEADAIMVKDLEALKNLPAGAVRDRIVYFSNRMERTRDGSGYGRAVTVRVAGPSAAAALGASGVVIRSVGTSDERFPHTGALRYTAEAPRIPAFAISNPDADALERQFASGKPVRLHMASDSRELPQARSANVIGEVPGTDRASEIVILGAHLDSWDPGARRHRRWRGRCHHDERRQTHPGPGQQAAAHDSRGAVRERGIRNLRLAGLPGRESGERSASMCWASRRISALVRCGAWPVASTRRSCRRSTRSSARSPR